MNRALQVCCVFAVVQPFTNVCAENVRADIAIQSDLTLFAPQTPAPGLLFSNGDVSSVPRLSMFFDAQFGERWTLHTLLNVDRGFDPMLERDGDVRLDEYYVQANVLRDGRLSVRVGKFAAPFGNWVTRHFAADNAFVNAPVAYENVVTVSDGAAPANLPAFVARRDQKDNKGGWVPIVWGPSYTTGASISTRGEVFDAVVEIKNAALSSRPTTWDNIDEGFDAGPTVTGRLGWRAAPEWSLGSSFSHGGYMQNSAENSLPSGASVDDFQQSTVGVDASYAHHRLQVWSELVYARFEVPRVGDVAVLSGYVEARYKLNAQFSIASRWNQSWFDDVPGQHLSWMRDFRRLDLALGYRVNERIQTKLQYSIGDQAGNDTNGEQLVGLQVSVWF